VNQCGKRGASRTLFIQTSIQLISLKYIEAFRRTNYMLTDEMNRVAIRVLHLMHHVNEEYLHTYPHLLQTLS
jgi:hypothetical protein